MPFTLLDYFATILFGVVSAWAGAAHFGILEGRWGFAELIIAWAGLRGFIDGWRGEELIDMRAYRDSVG